jgi:hypothetical protein
MFDNSQINVFNAIKGSQIYGSLNDLIFVLGMKTKQLAIAILFNIYVLA